MIAMSGTAGQSKTAAPAATTAAIAAQPERTKQKMPLDIKTTYNEKDDKGKTTSTRKSTVTVDWPDGLKALVVHFGEDVVDRCARDSLIVKFQNEVRTAMGDGANDKDLQKTYGGKAWKPEIKARGKSEFEKMRERLAKLDPEARKRLLKEAAA